MKSLRVRFSNVFIKGQSLNKYHKRVIDTFLSRRTARRSPAKLLILPLVCLFSSLAASQTTSPTVQPTATRDQQAVTIASQSLQALTGGTTLRDLTLQGSATYTAGPDVQTGVVTLLASGNVASRLTLNLTDGQRTEIRNGPAGDWTGTDAVEHSMATHNCWPDADWFYPGLSFQALNSDPSLGIAYAGLESKSGVPAIHLRLFRAARTPTGSVSSTIQKLSTEDIYLDASSYLPLFLDFNTHPDDDFGSSIPVEIAFSAYQKMSGVQVPVRIQKYLNGSVFLDLTISSAITNSGLPASDFAVTDTTGGAQ